MEKKSLDTATKAGVDALKTSPEKYSIKQMKQQVYLQETKSLTKSSKQSLYLAQN